MRITGGNHRGRVLASPEGLQTRPTSDRARQAVFNILGHAGWATGASRPDKYSGALAPGGLLSDGFILDLFAGTGALGLEALSRGAANAVFVEKDPNAARTCQKNIDMLKIGAQSVLLKNDATAMTPRPASLQPRTLVFLDPPYGKNLGAAALKSAATRDWLADGAVCVFEMSKKEPEETPEGFTVMDERVYGVAMVRFLIFNAA